METQKLTSKEIIHFSMLADILRDCDDLEERKACLREMKQDMKDFAKFRKFFGKLN